MAESLLSPDLLRRLERLQIKARRRAQSALKGERRSRARGQSVEFADYRDYVPGDDLRYLDWNLYGRLDRLYIKLYEEERELAVRLYLDASESMLFGEPTKFDFARRVAAAIGHTALCGFDRVAVSVFPAQEADLAAYGALRSLRGRAASPALLRHLAGLRAGGRGRLNEALRRGAIEARRPGLVVALSDFLDPEGYEDGLRALVGRGAQVTVVHILAPEEIEPNRFGDLRLVDCETGATQEVTFGKFRLQAYKKTLRRFQDGLKGFCLSRGIGYVSCVSSEPIEEVLFKRLTEAEVWG